MCVQRKKKKKKIHSAQLSRSDAFSKKWIDLSNPSVYRDLSKVRVWTNAEAVHHVMAVTFFPFIHYALLLWWGSEQVGGAYTLWLVKFHPHHMHMFSPTILLSPLCLDLVNRCFESDPTAAVWRMWEDEIILPFSTVLTTPPWPLSYTSWSEWWVTSHAHTLTLTHTHTHHIWSFLLFLSSLTLVVSTSSVMTICLTTAAVSSPPWSLPGEWLQIQMSTKECYNGWILCALRMNSYTASATTLYNLWKSQPQFGGNRWKHIIYIRLLSLTSQHPRTYTM